MKTRGIVLWIFLLALGMSACSGGGMAEIEGRTWTLTEYNGTAPIEGAEPYLQITDGQVSGRTGCNSYGGGVEINGDSIQFSALFQTEMACLDPEGLMEQERAYLELLGQAASFSVTGDVLTITTSSGETLVYMAQS